jgi:hypothetical protein
MMDDLFNSTSLNYDKSYDEVKQHIISEIS